MSEKLGKGGLVESLNWMFFNRRERESWRSGVYAQRDALLDALDAMPLPEHAKEETAGLPRCGELCPACAVLADRAAFRKMVLSHE